MDDQTYDDLRRKIEYIRTQIGSDALFFLTLEFILENIEELFEQYVQRIEDKSKVTNE